MSLRKTLYLWRGKVRRWWLCRFHPEYVKRQLAARTGECQQCGACCSLGLRCPFLDAEGLCRIYTSGWRPRACVAFPLDARDIEEVRVASGKTCGYSFPERREKPNHS